MTQGIVKLRATGVNGLSAYRSRSGMTWLYHTPSGECFGGLVGFKTYKAANEFLQKTVGEVDWTLPLPEYTEAIHKPALMSLQLY